MFEITNIPAKASFGPTPTRMPATHSVQATAAISFTNPDGQKRSLDTGAEAATKTTGNNTPSISRGTETVELGQSVPAPATYSHIARTPHGIRAIHAAWQDQNRRVA